MLEHVSRIGARVAGLHRCTTCTRCSQLNPANYLKNSRKTLHCSLSSSPPNTRPFSSTSWSCSDNVPFTTQKERLTHLTQDGAAHMVHIPPPTLTPNLSSSSLEVDSGLAGTTTKPLTARLAIARCVLRFSNSSAIGLIRSSSLKKGDALAVGRIAGIMGAKRAADLIPLCHNIPLSGVSVDIEAVRPGSTTLAEGAPNVKPIEQEDVGEFGGVVITARVHTFGQTGVEMEALTAATVAGLTVYDMCKAVDKGMRLENCRVVLKEGGKSGRWAERT